MRVIKDYHDGDNRYSPFPAQQGKKRQVTQIPSRTIPGALETVVIERRIYNPEAPHPDNKDW